MRKAVLWLLFALVTLSAQARAETFFSVLPGPPPQLVSIDPGTPIRTTSITGLQAGEVPVGIALRPATGELYVVGSASRLYRLSPATGAATQVGPVFPTLLAGTTFGLAFDGADRLRVVSGAGQNLRIDPTTGAVTVDTPLAFAAGDPNFGQSPHVDVIAYDRRSGGATAYGVDNQLHVLVRIGAATASDGTLTTIASGVPALVGLDVSTATGAAFGLEPGFTPELVTLSLQTGAATPVAPVGGQFTAFRGLAVAGIVGIPTLGRTGMAVLTLALALGSLLVLRRRGPSRRL